MRIETRFEKEIENMAESFRNTVTDVRKEF